MTPPHLAALRIVKLLGGGLEMDAIEQVRALWKYELNEMCQFAKCPGASCTGLANGRDGAGLTAGDFVLFPLAFVLARRFALASQTVGQLPARRPGAVLAGVIQRLKTVPGWLLSGLCAVWSRKP